MSITPVEEPESPADPLLLALRHLPVRTMEAPAEARIQRQARAAYLRGFERSSWHDSASGLVGRLAVPVFLAGIVGLYMTWAFAAATALVH
jgi:hypothetical protein